MNGIKNSDEHQRVMRAIAAEGLKNYHADGVKIAAYRRPAPPSVPVRRVATSGNPPRAARRASTERREQERLENKARDRREDDLRYQREMSQYHVARSFVESNNNNAIYTGAALLPAPQYPMRPF